MSRQSRNRPTEEEIGALDTFRMRAKTAPTYCNATINLMSNAGHSKPPIAEALGCGTATVKRVRRLYQTLGIIGLTPIKLPDRPSRLSQALREPVLPAIQADLNLIERLWGHLKRAILAKVMFQTMDDLVAAFHRGIRAVNVCKDRMGFTFDHDEVALRMTA